MQPAETHCTYVKTQKIHNDKFTQNIFAGRSLTSLPSRLSIIILIILDTLQKNNGQKQT